MLNARHKVARERGWNEHPPSKTAFRAALLEDDNLLRRPVVLRDGRLVVGRDLAAIEALLR